MERIMTTTNTTRESQTNAMPTVSQSNGRTRPRAAVAATLADCSDFVTAQQLHATLQSRGHQVSLATVYRSLQALASDGTVDVVPAGDGASLYRRCSSEHHHHLICRGCRRTIEVDSAAVEQWATAIAATHQFTNPTHTLEILGTCTDCAT